MPASKKEKEKAPAGEPTPLDQWHSITIRVPFLTNQHAQFAMRAIEVDKERQPQAVRRVLSVEDRDLVATFHTLTVRLARIVAHAYLENVDLVVRTLATFGDDAAAAAAARTTSTSTTSTSTSDHA